MEALRGGQQSSHEEVQELDVRLDSGSIVPLQLENESVKHGDHEACGCIGIQFAGNFLAALPLGDQGAQELAGLVDAAADELQDFRFRTTTGIFRVVFFS